MWTIPRFGARYLDGIQGEKNMPEWLKRLVVQIHDGLPRGERDQLLSCIDQCASMTAESFERVRWMIAIERNGRMLDLLRSSEAPFTDSCMVAIGNISAYLQAKVDSERIGNKESLSRASREAIKAASIWAEKERRKATRLNPVVKWPFKGTGLPSSAAELEAQEVKIAFAMEPALIAQLAVSTADRALVGVGKIATGPLYAAKDAVAAMLMDDPLIAPWRIEAETLIRCMQENYDHSLCIKR